MIQPKYQLLIILLIFTALNANDVDVIYHDLNNLSVMENQVASVKDFKLEIDVAEFDFLNGELILLSPVNHRTVAAVFEGKGNISFVPPTKVSKQSLYAEFQVDEYHRSFNRLFMIFNRATLEKLRENLVFTSKDIATDYDGTIQNCLNFLSDHKADDEYGVSIIRAMLNAELEDYLYVQFCSYADKKNPMFFEYDPARVEEVEFSKRKKRKTMADNYQEIICSFHCEQDRMSETDLSLENKDQIIVDRYIIDAHISTRLDFSANCKMKFRGLNSYSRWINLGILPKLEIDKIEDEQGNALNFFKKTEGFDIWVQLPEEIGNDRQETISIDYHGDLIYQGGNVVKIRNYNYWYPQYSSYRFKDFELTFHHPPNYDLISVGTKVMEKEADKLKITKWQTNYPVNYAPFNMGKFQHEEFQHQDLPILVLYLDKNLDDAKADVANSLEFYQNIYGECIFDTLTVVEIPIILSGQAFPGLINFYSDDFLTDAIYKVYTDINIKKSDFVQLRAHEVAHQWWGCGVESRTYHEKWLYEGLAEFSSIWFVQSSLNDNDKYFEILNKWRNTIIDQHYLKRKEKKQDSPVWLGSRAPYYINYGKGAWVLHMLRNLMIDLETFEENRFKAMLRDFYFSYKNKSASTQDFHNIVERHMGMDMDWFFRQWIYGNQIPKFDFDYDIKKGKDNKYVAVCRIKQENVNDNFKSYLPFEIDFGDERLVRKRVLVEGAGKEFEINLPIKPKKITFNIFDSVLAE